MKLLKVFLMALAMSLSNPGYSIALSDGDEIDHIVAVVNDGVITRSELEREMAGIISRLQQSGNPMPPRSAIEQQVLEQLIAQKLQLDKAEQLGISVTPDMLAQAVNNIAKNNNLTLSELRNSLESEGMSFKSFRKKLEKEILLSRLKNQEITSKISISEAEIDNLLQQDKEIGKKNNEYRISHILIGVPEGASAEQLAAARQKTVDVIKQLQNGADFANVAMMQSSGRQALEGGDLGWMKASQLPTGLADIVLQMNKGDISPPIRSASGYHIIQLTDIKGSTASFITQTNARHILINTGEMVSDEDARTRLEQLYLRIQGGDDFATLARSHSDDKASAIKGGELGWLDPGSVVEKFQQEMDALQPGEISKPFRTNFGWHIVQVLDRRQHDNSEKILRSEARSIITERKSKDATELYLRRLRDEAYVEIHLDDA